jgi:hypothetical protein
MIFVLQMFAMSTLVAFTHQILLVKTETRVLWILALQLLDASLRRDLFRFATMELLAQTTDVTLLEDAYTPRELARAVHLARFLPVTRRSMDSARPHQSLAMTVMRAQPTRVLMPREDVFTLKSIARVPRLARHGVVSTALARQSQTSRARTTTAARSTVAHPGMAARLPNLFALLVQQLVSSLTLALEISRSRSACTKT